MTATLQPEYATDHVNAYCAECPWHYHANHLSLDRGQHSATRRATAHTEQTGHETYLKRIQSRYVTPIGARR